MNIKISFPDGSIQEFPKGITPLEIAQGISKGLAKEALCAQFNDTAVDMIRPLEEDGSILFYKFSDEKGKNVYWHSSSHILAQAVKRLFPDVKIAFGPAIEQGFYYDFDKEIPFTEDDLGRIEEEMRRIIDEKFLL